MNPPTTAETRARLATVAGPRYPGLLAAVLLAFGIAIADRSGLSPLPFAAVTLAALVSSALIWRRGSHLVAILLTVVMLVGFGAWRIAVEQVGRPSSALIELFASPRPVEVFGRLGGVPVRKQEGWRVPLDIEMVGRGVQSIRTRGRVMLSTRGPLAGFRLGDYVRFEGYLRSPHVSRNPGGFDYADHLFRQGIDGLVYPHGAIAHLPQPGAMWSLANLVDPAREWIRRVFSKYLDGTSRALMLGFLLGDTDQLPEGIFKLFQRTGTAHLLAVSGTNVWIVAGTFYLLLLLPLLRRVPRRVRALLTILVIVLFSFLTRNEPSVVRASLMAGLMLLGRVVWRPVDSLNSVGCAAVLILIVSPADLFRAGFQLSFGAVIGIIVSFRRLQSWHLLPRQRVLRWFVTLGTASFAATVACAPLTAWHFGIVPLNSVFANIAVVLLATAATYLGLAVLVLGLISNMAAIWAASLAHIAIEWTLSVLGFFNRFPGAGVTWTSPTPLGVFNLLLIIAVLLFLRHRYRWWRPVAYYATACFVILAARSFVKDAPYPTVALLDTGRQRVAAVDDGSRQPVWLADDPGIDPDLQQWVVEPFAREAFGIGPPDHWLPWRRTASDDDSIGLASSTMSTSGGRAGPNWRRYMQTAPDPGSTARVWADRLAVNGDTLVLIRDFPHGDATEFVARLADDVGASRTLIVPAAASSSQVRDAIARLRPANLLFFGSDPRRRDPGERLGFWRLRFPAIRFFDSGVNGGVILEFRPHGLTVVPTLSDESPPGVG